MVRISLCNRKSVTLTGAAMQLWQVMRSFTTYRPTGRGYVLKIRACFAKSSILIFTKSLGCDFSIRSQYAQVNSMQRSIKPPSEAKCLPRYLESQCYWKATEWRVFLLLYSFVILKGVLLERHYNHWALSLVQLYTQSASDTVHRWIHTCRQVVYTTVNISGLGRLPFYWICTKKWILHVTQHTRLSLTVII